jgi:DNA-binding response OmpR family regulator
MASANSGLHVLIVDPDQEHQRQVAKCLQPRYRVLAAASIAEAQTLIMAHQPQIILLEMDEPDGDGQSLLKTLRATTATKHLIVACVTHRASVRDKVGGFQAGADDYVVKPINAATFLGRIILLEKLHQIEH